MCGSNVIVNKEFTKHDLDNKQLIIKMLKYEEYISKSDFGQSLYKNIFNNPLTSLTVEYALNRLTLAQFGFNTNDENVAMYRTIFKTYYTSPFDYDEEVISSVHYMRENKCVYYKSPVLKLGEKIPNCALYNLDSSLTSLYDIIDCKMDNTVICAFSLT